MNNHNYPYKTIPTNLFSNDSTNMTAEKVSQNLAVLYIDLEQILKTHAENMRMAFELGWQYRSEGERGNGKK